VKEIKGTMYRMLAFNSIKNKINKVPRDKLAIAGIACIVASLGVDRNIAIAIKEARRFPDSFSTIRYIDRTAIIEYTICITMKVYMGGIPVILVNTALIILNNGMKE